MRGWASLDPNERHSRFQENSRLTATLSHTSAHVSPCLALVNLKSGGSFTFVRGEDSQEEFEVLVAPFDLVADEKAFEAID